MQISPSVWAFQEFNTCVWANGTYDSLKSKMIFLNSIKNLKRMEKMRKQNVKLADANWKKYIKMNNESQQTETNENDVNFDFISKTFYLEITKNLSLNKNYWRFSDETYEICWILYLSSPKCYKLLRQLLPIPSKYSLYLKFGSDLQKIKIQLSDTSKMEKILKHYFDYSSFPSNSQKIIASLCIDAFSFKSFQGMVKNTQMNSKEIIRINEANNEETFNNGFIYLIAPLNPIFPVKIVHIKTWKNGSYSDEIAKVTKDIINIIQKNGFRIWFQATDGDSGLHNKHKEFFETYILGYNYNSFGDLVFHVYQSLIDNDDLQVPIADPLHVFKNLRARLINHRLAITKKNENEIAIIDINEIRSILNLKKVLDDETQIGKMRDSYAVKLFTFANIVKLIKHEQYPAALLFFPYCCWVAAIYSPKISLELRFFLIELSFNIIYKMFTEIEEIKKLDIHQRGKETVVFTEELYVIRILNSIVAFGVSLIFGEDQIRLDALGTHLVENSIGIARQDSNDPRWSRILTSFAHAEMRKRYSKKYKMRIHVQGRINDGGCKISNSQNDEKKEKPSDWRIEDFVQYLFGSCQDDLGEFCKEPLSKLIEQISQIGQLDIHDYSINEAANSLIMARIISFNSK